MTYPVKYMPVMTTLGLYEILDTSISGPDDYKSVCTAYSLGMVHRLCKLLNESEGYRYDVK